MKLKPIARIGDTFSGTIDAEGIKEISGVIVSSPQDSTNADGIKVAVEGSKGEYICPLCNVPHTVTLSSLSNQGGVNGLKVVRLGDPCNTDVHETIEIKVTSGSESSKSS